MPTGEWGRAFRPALVSGREGGENRPTHRSRRIEKQCRSEIQRYLDGIGVGPDRYGLGCRYAAEHGDWLRGAVAVAADGGGAQGAVAPDTGAVGVGVQRIIDGIAAAGQLAYGNGSAGSAARPQENRIRRAVRAGCGHRGLRVDVGSDRGRNGGAKTQRGPRNGTSGNHSAGYAEIAGGLSAPKRGCRSQQAAGE